MTNAPQQPKKTSTAMLVVMVAGGCLLLGLFMSLGKALGYAGVVLGLLGAGGSVALLVKKPAMKKLAIWGALLSVLLVILSFRGAAENKKEAEQQAAAVAAAEKKADEEKARLAKVAATLDTNLSPEQLVNTCTELARAGAIPAAQTGKCGDALLVHGKSLADQKKNADAVALLEQALKLLSKKDEAQAALASAKAAVAAETGAADLKRAEEALAKEDFPKALEAAKAADGAVAAGLVAKPDDAALMELKTKIAAVVEKSDPQKRAAAEQAAYAAMNAKEHLAAAKAALAKGYEPKTQTGGDTHLAVRHLAAITPPAPEVAEAKKLQQEIDARRKREKVLTCDCELVKGRLVVTEESMGGFTFSKLQEVGVDGPNTLKNNAAQWFELPEVQSITVIEYAKYTDVRGNEQRAKVGEFTVSRARAKSINWDNVEPLNVLKVIDRAWMAPGVTTVNL